MQDYSYDVLEKLEEAEQLKLTGQHKEALAILEELLTDDPENIAAYEEVADNELSLENIVRAERAARRAILLDEQSYTGHYILGFLLTQRREWPDALRRLKRANELKSNNAEILRCLGWALFHAGRRVEGVVTLERSLNLDENNPLILCDLGAVYLKSREVRKARPLLERAHDLDPQNQRICECVRIIRQWEKQGTAVRAVRKQKA